MDKLRKVTSFDVGRAMPSEEYVVHLEKALAYCQDDKEVMQNEIDVLKAELAAHRENEGDECPLCACEEQLQQAQDELER